MSDFERREQERNEALADKVSLMSSAHYPVPAFAGMTSHSFNFQNAYNGKIFFFALSIDVKTDFFGLNILQYWKRERALPAVPTLTSIGTI